MQVFTILMIFYDFYVREAEEAGCSGARGHPWPRKREGPTRRDCQAKPAMTTWEGWSGAEGNRSCAACDSKQIGQEKW